MTDRLAAAERALASRGGVEREGDGFVATTTPFDATVRLEPVDGAVRYVVEVVLPTLDAVVADETVARVVRDGWFETLERRLEDLDGALRASADPPTVERDEAAGTVTVRAAFDSARPDRGAADVVALVGYVEGTYLEGVIPGYAYREPVAGLIERARERSGAPAGS